MPNYEKRYQTADEIRRDVDYARRNYPMTPKNMAILNEHMKYADMLENQNEREEMRRGGRRYMRYENDNEMEMRYREKPGRYNEQDRPRQEYDEEPEMRRRRDSRGRYMNYDNKEYNTASPQRYSPNRMPENEEMTYYPGPYGPHEPPYMTASRSPQSKHQIGFLANEKQPKRGQVDEKREFDEMVEELKEYLEDYAKHSKLAKETKDPQEQEHARMELSEAMEYMSELMSKIAKMAHSPQEKQEMQKAMQKMQQEVQRAQQQNR